jgi:peroxiredoxin Q/BCP
MPSKAKPVRPTKKVSSVSKQQTTANTTKASRPSSSPNQKGKSSSRAQPSKQPGLPKKTQKSSQTGTGGGSTQPLQVGNLAPDFSLSDETGNVVNLSEFRGKKVVVYFYPKDDTPGCTTEACSFRDNLQVLKNRGAVVFGVSADSVPSHRKFVKKHQLNFPLLSDESKTMIHAYGVWKEKSLYGRKFMGIERTTVVINEDGTIRKIFPKVKVNEHVAEVLHSLD